MQTIKIHDQTKKKLQILAQRLRRSEADVLDSLVTRSVPEGRTSIRDALKGKISEPLTWEDFDALHQDMVKLYGQRGS